MRIKNLTAVLTGATGGIGRAIAAELLDHGAALLMVARDKEALSELALSFADHKDRVATIRADITDPTQREQVCDQALHWRGGVNALINTAGICDFSIFQEQSAARIDAAFAVNVQAPIHLCHVLIPHLQRAPAACIVNVGSVYGAIGYPGYAVYSATKFALRGFTEALRRELDRTSVRVHYLAPRATQTSMNSPAAQRLNAELRVTVDPPNLVARELRSMIERGRPQAVVGTPESFFARVNAVAPGIVDSAIRKQWPVIRRHASRSENSLDGA